MILYHGSNQIVTKPDVQRSKSYLDFGRGFYLTTYRDQAVRWAMRKFNREGGGAYLNVFEMRKPIDEYRIKDFQGADEEWLDFVCDCRDGKSVYEGYDIIIGNVANDDVFKTIDMYRRGLWDKQRTLSELRYYKANNQYCFVSQTAIDEILVNTETVKVG